MVVSVATKTYLALPERGSLSKGHCIIAPMEHLPSTVSVDEDIWQEIRVDISFIRRRRPKTYFFYFFIIFFLNLFFFFFFTKTMGRFVVKRYTWHLEL